MASPPLFVGGDSAGGGTALSTLLALQRAPERLARGRLKPAGGFFFSPWTNLYCNTPDYYLNAFAEVQKPGLAAGTALIGDVIFRGHPNENSDSFRQNARLYVGKQDRLLTDPVLSPMHATPELLEGLPPLYFVVGGAESIKGDSVLLAQRAAQLGVPVYLDVYPGMWHVFPMYSEGCGNPLSRPLWQGESALNRTATFLGHLGRTGEPPCPPSRGRVALMHHYSKPAQGWGHAHEWFPATFCGGAVDDGGPHPSKSLSTALLQPWRCGSLTGERRAGCTEAITQEPAPAKVSPRHLQLMGASPVSALLSLLVALLAWRSRLLIHRVKALEQENQLLGGTLGGTQA